MRDDTETAAMKALLERGEELYSRLRRREDVYADLAAWSKESPTDGDSTGQADRLRAVRSCQVLCPHEGMAGSGSRAETEKGVSNA